MAVADILLTPARVLYSPVGTSLPADTLAAGAAWPAGWVDVGLTKEPLKWKYEFDTIDFDVQESLVPINRKKVSEKCSFSSVLAEFTGKNMSLMWDAQVSETAAGVGQPAKEEITMGDLNSLQMRQWGFEGSYEDASGNVLSVRLFVWRATSTSGGEVEFGKKDYSGIPLEISALSDLTKAKGQRLFKIVRLTAPASS